jgi:hypothetical protein
MRIKEHRLHYNDIKVSYYYIYNIQCIYSQTELEYKTKGIDLFTQFLKLNMDSIEIYTETANKINICVSLNLL